MKRTRDERADKSTRGARPDRRPGLAHNSRTGARDLDQLAQKFREDPEAFAAMLADLLERGDQEIGRPGGIAADTGGAAD